MAFNTKTKRNFFVSYLKGWAIISIILIHLIDWSNRNLSASELWLKELLYPSVLFFIATAGSVVYLAYAKYDLWTSSKKLWRRGGELVGVYFLYNILKLYLYDFSAEPFYAGFVASGKLTLYNILSLQAFTAPISIILTIGVFLIITPLFLFLAKRKLAKLTIGLMLAVLVYVNYFLPLPANVLTDWLYAKNNIMFPLALWLVPYLLGFYLAIFGLEKHKGRLLVIFTALTASCAWPLFNFHESFKITYHMYPLKLYYLLASFAFMYLLFYLFSFLEKAGNRAANFLLALLRLLGDSTLAIYIYHWAVIDLTLWAFYPRLDFIWLTVPLFLICYIILKYGQLREYYKSY